MKRKCTLCREECEIFLSDEEVLAEFKRDFPNYPAREATFVCNACYQRIMESNNVNLQ